MTAARIALVVEDDITLQKLVVRALERMGFTVQGFGDGEAALAWIDDNPAPDLVCLDLALPAMSGFRVCEAIRGDTKTKNVPVMVLTARTSMQDHTFALEVGADAFLEKPFKLKTFEDEVKAILAR